MVKMKGSAGLSGGTGGSGTFGNSLMPMSAGNGAAGSGTSPGPQPTATGGKGASADAGAPATSPPMASAGTGGTSGAAGTPAGAVSSCGLVRPVKLGLHLVVDESASMVFPSDLWSPLGKALDGFIASDSAARLQLGVQFFQGSCDRNAYATPSLAIAPVADAQQALDAAMSQRTHGPGAATALALDGAIAHARRWATDAQGNAAVVLISGSEPTGCFGSASSAAMTAAAGLQGTPPVPTYVVALGAVSSLDTVAKAGGTGAALSVSDPTSEQAILGAIQAALAQAGCEYALPAEAAPYLPDHIGLQLTTSGSTSWLTHVADMAACDASSGGWHYDDPQSPKRAVLCEASCKQVGGGGSVSVVLGCPGAP
jgi:hypothetical protein